MAEKKKKPFKGYNKKKHSRTGGLNDKERARINREEGSNLKRPVTGKVKAGSKAANRRKSFCARMSGVKGPTSKDGQLTPKGAALKRWKCRKSLQKSDMPPKAKLAAFLRDHIDNKLALKAAEPTITKSGELEKAISPEQQKENIRKQRELQNKQVVSQLKGKLTPSTQTNKQKKYMIDSGSVDLYDEYYNKTGEEEGTADTESYEYQKFLKDNKHSLPYFVDFHTEDDDWAGRIEFEPHQNGKNIHITHSEFEKEHQNKGLEEAAQKIAEEHYGKPLLTSKKTQPKFAPSKPKPTPAPAPVSSKVSHLRVVKSLNADKTGMSALMKALKEGVCKKSDQLAGGKGDAKDISDFDAKEVEMGLKVEMEHTNNLQLAKEIVADHLSEDPLYYSKLKDSGLADELEKAGRCWEGYEPTPGKKPYSKGSCRKIKKSISALEIESGNYQGEPLDSHHHNRLGVEYKGMAQKAHKMGDRVSARKYHDKALFHFKMADKMGFQEEEPLEKKISGKLAAAGLGLASAFSSQGKASDLGSSKINTHDAISMIESSGGKNIIHNYIDKNKTQRAISRYGLLPTRVIELYARSSEFRDSPTGKMVGEVVEPHLSKHKTKNFYDTAAFVEKTPKDVKKGLYEKINEITKNEKHDKAIFEASKKHSKNMLSDTTSDPVELEIMAAHGHHWYWPRTKKLYEKGGIDAVINDEKSKEGNYIKKIHKQLPDGHPVKERIEESLPKPKPVKKVRFNGS